MSLPVEIVFGVYLGIVTGIVPALVAGVLGFLFKYVTDVTIPGLGVVVLALAIAGVNGGLMALNDQTIRSSERAPALLTAIIVVLMLSLYAHAQGDKLGASVPKRISIRQLRDRTLSADVVELVGGRGRVGVEVAGEVSDMEGYPPLPAETRTAIAEGEWTFPADLPLRELENRFTERLLTEYDLADAAVRIDEKARATVAAAPPIGGLSKRVGSGKRAVSVSALVPTGIARGDLVRVITPDRTVDGTVIAARSSGEVKAPSEKRPASAAPSPGDDPDADPDARTDGGEAPLPAPAPTTTGGEGRVTLAVDRGDASALLGVDRGRVLVLSRGTRREYELTTLLRRAGKRFRRVTVVAGGPLDGHTIGEVGVRERYGVAVLAARHESWTVAPSGSQALSAGDDLFVVGNRDALDRFAEAAK
ncbi:potassium transporter TrkA [Halorubrum salipaludis]|uniref:Potassium transporter TrkA n=1 Tax=Halorubrum salipaludis TaxID=2032630 RepID=A0A2A2FB30_9EURY|nr:TrkA C-terminal domain-containing protein [Halorubrum salipaludis]PAU82701.1 potassium transporter TrkA [Halorubrum salipaludis]